MTPTQWPYTHTTPKDPDSTLDYQIDWSDWLSDEEVIISSVWTLNGVTSVSESFTNTACTIFVSGGTSGTKATLNNRITTNNIVPRIDERTLIIRIKNR